MDMLEQGLDTTTSHEKQETGEALQEEDVHGREKHSTIAIANIQETGTFTDHNVQYQFRTENSGGQVTYRVVQLTDDQIEAGGDGGGAVSVVSAAAFSGAQAVAQAVIQNPFSNGGSPAGTLLTQAGGQLYVMMNTPDVLQTVAPRTIAPRTHPYTTKLDGPRVPRDDRRRAQHNEVERRRRDKINNWIVTLSKMIPDCTIDSTKTGASKGGILSKACDYIQELRQNNQRLQDSFKDVERVQVDNELLRQQIEELKGENALLRAQLQQHGIEVAGETVSQ
ncbi:hypothetical protein ANANG_G00183450 [Anguilla anguilla]|uniref:BHLH domain-containing protein n=1 Tax=Anguilla anguilla TaxID=7936 RepID=A0A9D3RTK3_ANGAN|nr:hypothetical protein ANANG_G00183450 [Anguilla anguilla]